MNQWSKPCSSQIRTSFRLSLRLAVAAFAASLTFALFGCGGSSGGSTPTPMMFTFDDQMATPSPGQTWTYQQQVTPGSAASGGNSGTLTITYQGVQNYRGGNYFVFQDTGVAIPPTVNSYFSRNADGTFSEYADDAIGAPVGPGCSSNPASEDVLASPVYFVGIGSSTFSETFYQCGFQPKQSSDTLTVSDGGTKVINVPAGTISTRVRNGTLVRYGSRMSFTDYLAGMTVVRRDETEYFPNGNVSSQATTQLASGPLNVGFPGPPVLNNQGY